MRLPIALLGVVLAVEAAATTLLSLSTDELFRRSGVVAVVEVRDVRARNIGGEISTFATATVSRAFRGAKAGDELTLVVPGGVVGDLGQKAFGAPELSDGETCVAFLEPAGGGNWQFVGLEQGRVSIAPDATAPGGWVVQRSQEAAYVRPNAQGTLVPAAPLPAREPLSSYLDLLTRLGGGL